MKPDLLEILRCPSCRGELDVAATQKDAREILTGTLTCRGCHATYPIEDGIPDMLPPDQRD